MKTFDYFSCYQSGLLLGNPDLNKRELTNVVKNEFKEITPSELDEIIFSASEQPLLNQQFNFNKYSGNNSEISVILSRKGIDLVNDNGDNLTLEDTEFLDGLRDEKTSVIDRLNLIDLPLGSKERQLKSLTDQAREENKSVFALRFLASENLNSLGQNTNVLISKLGSMIDTKKHGLNALALASNANISLNHQQLIANSLKDDDFRDRYQNIVSKTYESSKGINLPPETNSGKDLKRPRI